MSSDQQVEDPVSSAPTEGSDADRVATAVRDVPGVHDLHGGVMGEVATYLPGRRVAGVRLRSAGDGGTQTQAEVHIVLDWNSPALSTADAVRRRVESLVDGPVHVVVEDIAGPPDAGPDAGPAHDSPTVSKN